MHIPCSPYPGSFRAGRFMAPVLLAGLISAWLLPWAALSAEDGPQGRRELEERIAVLIEQLGDEQFVIREQAQSELSELGLIAFDALNEALQHEDIEIVLRARYLLRSMRVQWFEEDDSPALKRLLQDYGSQRPEDRRSRMDRLANIAGNQSLRALCRLVRYDTDSRLSKRAALLVMQRPAESPPETADVIDETLSLSKRPGALWLRVYVRLLRNEPQALDGCDELIRAERQTLASASRRTSTELMRDLSRWYVEQLKKRGRTEEMHEAMRRSLELVDGSRDQVFEAAQWLMQNEAWALVSDLEQQFPDFFNTIVKFKYLAAESQLRQGDREQADRTAAQALALNSDAHEEHIEAAVALRDRGLVEWAAREFQERISANAEGAIHNLRARFLYSEMLHDGLQDDLKAAEVLSGAVQAMDENNAIEQRVRTAGRLPDEVRARRQYFLAQHFAGRQDWDKVRMHLKRGIEYDPEEVDVLIAMYRVPDADEEWIGQTRLRIDNTARGLRQSIQTLRDQRKTAAGQAGPTQQQLEWRLASLNNQYAWLVGNTAGDYQDALACSLESLELTPGSPIYLDTLGRCYYAVQDYAAAVSNQSLACKMMPHSKLMQKQLELFQQALREDEGK